MSRLVVRGGDGDARLDGDLVGVSLYGDIGGFAGVGQAGLNLLAADHDGTPC